MSNIKGYMGALWFITAIVWKLLCSNCSLEVLTIVMSTGTILLTLQFDDWMTKPKEAEREEGD